MFVSERVVFVELHKTGGTHIGQWLQRLVGGAQMGKHNRVPPWLRERFIMGSVRNPWDWYVSLWAYGCAGSGSVRSQVTRRASIDYCRNQLPAEMGKQRLRLTEWVSQLIADARKPASTWRASYRSADDPGAFRDWLHLMLDSRRRFDMGEGYGFSPVSCCAGLLTYRYLKLFTSLDQELYRDPELATVTGMRDAMQSRSLVSHIIRNEFLEDDLLAGLNKAGVPVSPEAESDLRRASTMRTNSSRRRDAAYYYDTECVELVAEKESLVIEKHGYSSPL
ncbi:MAG: hypothetical protein CALGDGBN_00681 [Pseudomonadales bacterium]|nr:hypothetical protein [Pseudomonadales bacterium]